MNDSAPSRQPGSMTPEERRELLHELVEEHSDVLYRQAYRYFHDAALAEDLVQETFLAAAQALAKFEGRSSYKTWLQGILRHKILDRIRKKTKEEVLLTEHQSIESQMPEGTLFNKDGHWENATGPLTWANNPESVAEQKDFLRTLGNCLSKFPSNLRQLFLLREIEGMSREELCKEFGLSSSNVGVILYRMRLSLQQCLQMNWIRSRGEV